MRRKERCHMVLKWFKENKPIAETELNYANPFELLIAVVLSAQCTDKRVNLITPALFESFPTPESMKDASVDEVYEYIKSVTYPNSKAKYLVGLSKILSEDFNGVIPQDEKSLMRLPGVGRKTANVILSILYEQPKIAVDTHVFRVSRRIGLVPLTANTPLKVEYELMKYIPEDLLAISHHWLILHGRYVCLARSPRCSECGLTAYCRYYEKRATASQKCKN